MLRSLIRLWALVLVLMSSQAFALGLGDIRLDSALNEPLRAEILLTSATPEELDNLTVQIAPPDIFERYGLDRPAYLSSVSFRVFRSGRTDGNVIRLTSSEPITEPFLTFLVEASWSRGRLLREYTVLLDPPTFAPPSGESITQTVQPPVQTAPADSGRIQRPAPAPTPAPAPAPPRAAPSVSAPAPAAPPSQPSQPAPSPASFDTTPGGEYVVQRGDTLWNLASRMRPDNRLTINQTMLAIFEANPEAFADNINVLSAGASLRIPSADEVFRITRAEAIAEVQRQNSAWQGGDVAPAPVASTSAPQPSLELVPPDEDALSSDSTTVYDGPDLSEPAPTTGGSLDDIRIAEIEDLLADQQSGLVVVSDNELAALRRELAELRGEPIPDDLLPDAEPVDDAVADDEVFVADDEAAADDEIFIDDSAEPVAADDATAADASPEPEVEAPAPTPAPAPAPQESLVDTILGYLTGLWGMVGAAVLLVLAAVAFFLRRSRGASGGDDDATALWQALDEESLAEEAAGESTSQMRAPSRADETIVVEEGPGLAAEGGENFTATMEIPASAGNDEDVAAITGTNEALEDTFSSDTALNLDQSDPIAEADFHMAYGLYDQAADLINGALAVDAQRPDLLAKLCEIYFVWGNRDAFIDAALRFKGLLGDGEDPEWDKTVIMGQQIASDHELFSDAQGATKAVDLAFDEDGGDAALDMDLAAGEAMGDDVIDLGGEAAPAAATNDDSALDFIFDDGGAGSGETAVTEQMPAPDAADLDVKTTEMPAMDEATAEMPTVESSLDETGESPSIEDQLTGQFDDLDATGELPGLDETSTGEMPSIGDDEATRLASLDDDDDSAASMTTELPAIGDDEATTLASLDDDMPAPDATAEIDLDDLGLDLDTVAADLDDTSMSQALDLDALDATGTNEALADVDPTGTNDVLDDTDIDLASETTLLEATGQTQILPEDFAVETGTGTNIEKALAEDADGGLGGNGIADDAETMLASLDDEETEAGDFDFAKTEALPKDSFTPGVDDAPGSTDMDLDLDDLTAALKMSAAGDTVNQVRDDATVEQPRPDALADETPTAAIAPDELSDDLHDARTMTEVGTKLDLARAYVDMGDPGGARSILEEVLDEGDESQRQQAQQLLDSLPA